MPLQVLAVAWCIAAGMVVEVRIKINKQLSVNIDFIVNLLKR